MIKVNALDADGSTQIEKVTEAITALGGAGSVRVYVKDDTDAQGLLDFASSKNLAASRERPCKERCAVTIDIPEDYKPETSEESEAAPKGKLSGRNAVVVISDVCMGGGDEEFGRELMKHFLYVLSRQDKVPHAFVFFNSAVRFTCEESPELEDLKLLEQEGVLIVSGDASLKHYGLNSDLKVGRAANMYEITDILIEADHIIKP